MTILEHSTQASWPLQDIYALAMQVERYPDILPGYLESRIIQKNRKALLLQRASRIRGRIVRWKSWVSFDPNRAIHFVHAEGPLQGMQVEWIFQALEPAVTRITITHRFHLSRPWVFRHFLEKWVYKPVLDEMASKVVQALHDICAAPKKEALA